jgi:hypothetical protein
MPKVALEGSAYLIDEQNRSKGLNLDDDDVIICLLNFIYLFCIH